MTMEKMMNNLVGAGDGVHCLSCRPLFVQCACQRWQIYMYYDNDVTIYTPNVFDTKMEAAEAMADLIHLLDIKVGSTPRPS